MSEIITTGKTVDEAIEEGCRVLGVSKEEASIEILEMPARKLFRTIPARVRVTRNEDEFSVKDLLSSFGKPERKEEKPAQQNQNRQKEEKPAQQNQSKQKERKPQKPAREEKKPEEKEQPAAAPEAEKKEEAPAPEKKPGKKKNKKKKSAQNAVKKEAEGKTAEAAAEEEAAEAPEILEYLAEADLPERAAKALGYLRSIVAALGFEKVEYAFGRTEKGVRFILSGEDAPNLIGRRGETMDALQYLCTVGSSREGGDYCRISLDIEGYRSRREEALAELAAKTAAKVKKNGYNQVLEPMNPYERRIVHAAIQKIEGVTSHSVGSEPFRKVVVTPEGGGERRNRGRKGGRRKDGSRPRSSRPMNDGYENTATEEDIRAVAEKSANVQIKKELKSQEEFVGALYGKIEL